MAHPASLRRDAPADHGSPARVWLVGAGPGSADLLTVRALRLLQTADVVLHDALVSDEIRSLIPSHVRRIDVGKRKGAHAMAQRDIEALMVREARAGARVVRLKAGDPLVFGRAGEELAALDRAGIAVEVVPGVTAALAAAADAALPLTLRGVASSLVFVTAQDAAEEPAEGPEGGPPLATPDWRALVACGATIAIYMGRSAGGSIRGRLQEAGLTASTPVLAVENAGRADRRLMAGTVDDLPALSARDDLSGPVMIIVGPAVAAAKADPSRIETLVGLALARAA